MRNNYKFAEKRQHFSIRKLTIGAASVLLGTSLWLGTNGRVAQADTAESTTDKSSVVETNNQSANDDQTSEVKDLKIEKEDTVVNAQNSKDDATETDKGNSVATSVDDNKEVQTAAATDAAKQTYNVKVTLKDISSKDGNVTLLDRGWNYNFKDDVLALNDVKDGTRIYSLGVPPTGYKLLNPEVLTQNFRMDGNVAYVNGKDADVTLEYARISPVLVKYVDEDTGEVLSSSSVGANTSSTASLEYEQGDKTAIGPSKFKVVAIDIPGYKIDGDTEFVDTYNNVQSLGNPNYQVVTFKYKKVMDNPNPKHENGSGAQYGEYFGPQWDTIDPADMFTVSGVKGQTYEKDNGDIEAKIDGIVKKYENKGFSYIGTFNYHKNTDYYNWNEASTTINLVPNKNVTVKFVDEKGNELAPNEILAGNANNPNQINNGINEAQHWYSAGEWTATPKKIDGYTLRTTYGATKGQYTPYKYVVTFEYAKDTTGKVIYIDDNAADSANNVLKIDNLTGFVGNKIDYSTAPTIEDFEKQGYVLVSDGFNTDAVYKELATDNTFEVHLKHGVQPITPTTPTTDVPKNTPKEAQPDQLTKKVNLTVNYVNADGTTFTGEIPANAHQTVTFTGTAYVDKVTGQLVNAKQENGKWVIDTANTATPQITWTSDKTGFEGVTSPVEESYHVTNVSSHADGNNVAAITGLTKDSSDIAITVTYTKDNPGATPTDPKPEPTPDTNVTPQPETPSTPDTPNTDEPETPSPAPHAGKVEDQPKSVNTTVKNLATTPAVQSASEKTLPQTGEENTTKSGVIGAIAAGLGLIGLAGTKKRRNN